MLHVHCGLSVATVRRQKIHSKMLCRFSICAYYHITWMQPQLVCSEPSSSQLNNSPSNWFEMLLMPTNFPETRGYKREAVFSCITDRVAPLKFMPLTFRLRSWPWLCLLSLAHLLLCLYPCPLPRITRLAWLLISPLCHPAKWNYNFDPACKFSSSSGYCCRKKTHK